MADIVVKITGTKLALTYCVVPAFTGKHIKEKLYNSFGIPVSRQTLILPNNEVLADDRSLNDFGYKHGGAVDLSLQVEDKGSVPINVNLVSDQPPSWKASVQCMESTTVGQLKNMVASKLGWTDGNLGGMELEEGVNSQTMRDDNATILNYLVVNGSTVEVVFKNRVPSN
ncbi:hypothetical protein LINPERPRIM_LOCUS32732 [Linum perenne]